MDLDAERFHVVRLRGSFSVRAGRRERPGLIAAGAGPMLMLLRDYKPFGGRLIPTTMIMRMAGMETVSRTVHMDSDPIPLERFKQP